MYNEITNDIQSMDFLDFEPEKDDGNIEYKWKLTNLSKYRIEKLTTQMKYRLNEGSGEAIYEIGIDDNGFPKGLTKNEYQESINNLTILANNCNADILLIKERDKECDKEELYIAEFLVRERNRNGANYLDIHIVVSGNVDSGKSTTIGVLTTGTLDNGRGKARVSVFNYLHEMNTGRTSSIGHQILGFNSNGKIVNETSIRKLSWPEIVENSSKIISFYDLAGHEKYLRTTIYGFSSTYPDYAMVLIGANMGVEIMTKEHIALCLTYKIPFFILFTKIDIAPEHKLNETKEQVLRIMKSPGLRKMTMQIKNMDDVVIATKNMLNGNLVPMIDISNVSGYNLDLLKTFLNLLPIRKDYKMVENKPIEFEVDGKYLVKGIGTVVSGYLLSGTVRLNDNVIIGPDSTGSYKKTQIKSIHYNRILINEAKAGNHYCFALKKIERSYLRRGMAIISINEKQKPPTVWKFTADITVVSGHHTTIKKGFEPIAHINNISQSCRIDEIIGMEYMRSKDKATVRFSFKYHPEYIKTGYKIVFREGRVKGIGIITEIL